MPKKSIPSQEFVEVEIIKDGVVVLRGKGLRRVLAVDGLNLDLRSEEERETIKDQFQSLLNSLDFSLEIIIHSRQMNLAEHIEHLESKLKEQRNELLATQLREYIEFLKQLGIMGNIMKKQFFVVVPYDPVMISKRGLLGLFKFGSKSKERKANLNKSFEEMKFQLEQRVEVVGELLKNIGLEVLILDTQQVIELFYNLYNPGLVEKTNLEILRKVV